MTDMNTNTGYFNTGDRNTGYFNTGDKNTGHGNTGYINTGHLNTGDKNTGDKNTGYWNTGDWNAGDRNTGDWNAGDRNTGDWNAGDGNTGYFNTISPKGGYIFDQWCDDLSDIDIPEFCCFKLTEWITDDKMTEEEKENHPEYKTTGGYLREKDYKEAFRDSFFSYNKEERVKQIEKLKQLPNFDKDIFYEISGIDIDDEEKHTIIIDGKEIELSEESYNNLKDSLFDNE